MLQRYKWLLRRGKDFSDLPDCQGLDEIFLNCSKGKAANFLGVKAKSFGAQDRFDLFQSGF